jgi:hypothetical protein
MDQGPAVKNDFHQSLCVISDVKVEASRANQRQLKLPSDRMNILRPQNTPAYMEGPGLILLSLRSLVYAHVVGPTIAPIISHLISSMLRNYLTY